MKSGLFIKTLLLDINNSRSVQKTDIWKKVKIQNIVCDCGFLNGNFVKKFFSLNNIMQLIIEKSIQL